MSSSERNLGFKLRKFKKNYSEEFTFYYTQWIRKSVSYSTDVSVSASQVSFPITVYTAKAVISRSQFKRHPNLSMAVNMPLVCRSLCNIYATCNEAFHLRLERFHAFLERAQLLEDHVTSLLHCANFAYNWLRTSRSILRNYIQCSFKLNAWRARETQYVCKLSYLFLLTSPDCFVSQRYPVFGEFPE